MKKFLLSLALMASAVSIASAVTVPYSSDLGVGNQIVSDWTTYNGTNRAKSWQGDSDNTFPCATTGTNGGACKPYDADRDANCWLISPALTLTGGSEYTITLWVKTRGSDSENFAAYIGSGNTATALKAGTKLIDKPGYAHASDFEQMTMTFTPDASGDYYFGLYCYSYADSYTFYATGFSITGEGGGSGEDPDPDEPDQPEDPQYVSVPCTLSFATADDFAQWTSKKGPGTTSGENWYFRSYNSQVWLEDIAGQEDHYLISPAINFAEPGSYAITYNGTVYGDLELGLMTDPADLSTFTPCGKHTSSDFGITFDMPLDVAEAGIYHIALHACAKSGSSMGYRVTSVGVKSDTPVPALVTDLSVVADLFDALEVSMSWTMPSTDNHGNAISGPLTYEILRNGETIKEDTANGGQFVAYLDEVPAAGSYTYAIKVSNAAGCLDTDPIEVSSGFVGHPVAALDENGEYKFTNADADLCTVEDANADGTTFVFGGSYSWSKAFELKRENATDNADDYVCTPYFALQPGYYVVKTSVSARNNTFEVGYATNRRDIAGTFTLLEDHASVESYGNTDYETFMVVTEPGEYVIAVHAYGEGSTYDKDITVSSFGLAAISRRPDTATGISAVEDPENEGSIILSWYNPAVDNIGQPISEDETLKIEIFRGEELIATLDERTPGAKETYVDTPEASEEISYLVIAHLDGVSAENGPDPAYIFIGEANELPVSYTDFSDWTFVDAAGSAEWSLTSGDNHLYWYRGYGSENDYALSPFLNFVDGSTYDITFQTTNADYLDACVLNLVSAKSSDASKSTVISAFTTPKRTSEPMTHTLRVKATTDIPATMAMYAALDDEEEAPAEASVFVTPGKQRLGFMPTTCGDLTMSSFAVTKVEISGIEDVATDHTPMADAKYYDLQGVRVHNPAAGSLYICVRGDKAQKVIIR